MQRGRCHGARTDPHWAALRPGSSGCAQDRASHEAQARLNPRWPLHLRRARVQRWGSSACRRGIPAMLQKSATSSPGWHCANPGRAGGHRVRFCSKWAARNWSLPCCERRCAGSGAPGAWAAVDEQAVVASEPDGRCYVHCRGRTGWRPAPALADLVALRIRDVCHGEIVASRTSVVQHKTGHPVQFENTATTRQALACWIKVTGLHGDDCLFPSRNHPSVPLGTRQYASMVHGWVDEIGLDGHAYGTHSMRRTKATLIYRKTKNLRAVQLLLGRTKLESTVRHLGIELEDARDIAEQIEICVQCRTDASHRWSRLGLARSRRRPARTHWTSVDTEGDPGADASDRPERPLEQARRVGRREYVSDRRDHRSPDRRLPR